MKYKEIKKLYNDLNLIPNNLRGKLKLEGIKVSKWLVFLDMFKEDNAYGFTNQDLEYYLDILNTIPHLKKKYW